MTTVRRTLLAVSVGCALSLAGCGAPGPIPPAGKQGYAGREFKGRLEALHPSAVSPADLGTADRAFGLRLLQDACAAAPTANAVLSPASAAQTLGMMRTGAAGATRTALSTLLHQPAYGPAVIAAEHERTSQLHMLAGLSTANRLFTQSGTTPQQATLDDLRTAYGAQLRTLDFLGRPRESTDAINHLVAGDTHGLIPRLFGQPLDSTTVAVLTNAIYLKAQWEDPFEPAVPGAFTTADGRHVTVPTLKTAVGRVLSSASADGWRSVELPYLHGKLTAFALLPPAAEKPCAVPDSTTLTTLLRPDAHDAATVTMPKFHLAQTNQLLPVLAREGFRPDGDYPGFGGAHVSEIVQKVDISVDENGTKAAAATGGVFAMSAQMADTHVDLNRPFLFLVADTATHTPLFLTRVADPRG
ncbi:serpin family protein [Allobranchiibius sp. GilTou38]|uniref:serpin family protein n=1 Tax=Allobranchiibius sp. GilTou38 TaxID=2815210 RepID=UPI001AA1A08D|nr:serpin family protein [Allobranchiibius sp. GilTou38]